MDEDLVFALDMGLGQRLKVYVTGAPEDYRVQISNPDALEGFIGIAKCDWERIVERVAAQF